MSGEAHFFCALGKHWQDLLEHGLNGFDGLKRIKGSFLKICFNPFNSCSNKYSRGFLWLGIVLCMCSR